MAEQDPTNVLLRRAWEALGGPAADLELVEFVGYGDGLLPSTYAALPAMSAAVAASTLAASVLDAVRRQGSSRPVVIDRVHVAAAARSEQYARSDARTKEDRIAPLTLFWPTADGFWFRIHGEYPWHHARALAVLDCEDTHRSVKRAVAAWNAEDLEAALDGAGALGYSVRTATEWRSHPQGSAVAALPLVQGEVGHGSARPLGPGRAATGARVLDMTRVLAGPIATRTLAAWGAEVLRVDSPGLPELPLHALDMMSGKHSAAVDCAEPAGRQLLHELLAQADVLVQGYRPGALARFGLTPEELAEQHPHLCTVTLSAWGPDGPWSRRRGFDSLVQCAAGIAVGEGTGERPGWLPAQVLDHATGYLAAAASLLALGGAQRDGRPRHARLSLAQTAQWLMGAGPQVRATPRPVDVESYRVTLPGPSSPVEVIGPPGCLADLLPSWSFTTDPGVDAPLFSGARLG